MTWKETTIARILLILARMLADEQSLTLELQNLSNHITTHRE